LFEIENFPKPSSQRRPWAKESYSFYGLWHWLSEANDLLDQIDSISLSAPKTHVPWRFENRRAMR
jgi:hypothetical protein